MGGSGAAGTGGAAPQGDGALRAKVAAAATDLAVFNGEILQSLFPNGFSGDSARYLVADKLCEAMAKRVESMFTIPHFINVVASSSSASTCDFPDLRPACQAKASCDGAKMTIVFDQCTGPFGLVDIKGTLVASLALSMGPPTTVTAQVSTSGFQVGGYTIDQNTTVTTTIDVQPVGTDGQPPSLQTKSTALTVVENGMMTIHDAEGTVFTDQTELTVKTDMSTHCVVVNGSATVSLAGVTYPIKIKDVEECGGQCSSQGTATASPEDAQNAVTLQFDGTQKPKWMSKSGMTGSGQMSCKDKSSSSSSRLAASMLYGTTWACTGYNGKLSFMAPARMSAGIEARFQTNTDTTSCTGNVTSDLGTLTVDQCSMKSNQAVGILSVSTSGCVPDYYDMLGGFAVYDASGYWGGIGLFCEPCAQGPCRGG